MIDERILLAGGAPVNDWLIVGLTGPLGSGKGTVGDLLTALAQERGIAVRRLSLSDEIRAELRRRGESGERSALKSTADQYRARFGTGAWAALTASRIEDQLHSPGEPKTLFIVDGIRNTGEVYELRLRFGKRFTLLGIIASHENLRRYLQERNRADEPAQVLNDQARLQELINSELGSTEERGFGHNIAACLEMADLPVIVNDGTLADLQAQVQVLATANIFPGFDAGDALRSR